MRPKLSSHSGVIAANIIMPLQRSERVRGVECCAERQKTDLERIIKRKAKEVDAQVQDLGLDWMEDKLQDAMSQPLSGDQQFRFGRALSDAMMRVLCRSNARCTV